MTRNTAVRTRIFTCILAAAVVFAMSIMTQPAYADGPDGYAKFGKKMTVSTATHVVVIDMGKKDNNAKKVTVKSSKKKVAAPATGYIKYLKQPVVEIGKKGKTKLTIKIKKSGTKTYKGKLKVVAYKNPTKKIKIGSQTVTKKFKSGTFYYGYAKKAATEKITVKPSKGWKVKAIKQGYWSGDNYKTIKIKNGGKITWKGDDYIDIVMYKKSANQYETLILAAEGEY